MINIGKHRFESFAHILNADRSILKLNPALERLGYRFLWIDASILERDFSEIVNVPKVMNRPLPVMIGREQHGISHELHHALIHSISFGFRFMHLEFPGIILLRRIADFELLGDQTDFLVETREFNVFFNFTQDLLLQLRLFKIGEIRVSQFFSITSESRQIGLRKVEISIGASGSYTLSDEEAQMLSDRLTAKYDINPFVELAVKNFCVAYDLPDVRLRFITMMTCLESLFNLGKDQIAHTIARHLSLVISANKDQFQDSYRKIKKLYGQRNAIVHGGHYKGQILEDYLILSDYVRKAIIYCNSPNLSKESLFFDLNAGGITYSPEIN
ncbi:HEPN domain-containing protein [Algoriphagus terrigena]|uniref:HEPN domain-containing protein n=1 Tax=Algoriphagus terrigena TaxID=344884 RepID=UPI00040569B4|nr:HEPN domain-containing protein [Algoriphagus terrigena]